jgi:hypothetical protein
MKTIRAIATRACIIAALCVLGACSHGDSSSNAQDQTDVQSAASDAPASSGDASGAAATDASASAAPDSAASDSAASPVADVAAPTSAPSGDCRLIDRSSVEKAMHDSVDTVKVDNDSCDFRFKTLATDLTVEFDAQGGANELDTLKQSVGMATGALKAAVSAAPNGQMAAGVVTASTPRGIPTLGDDQFAYGSSLTLFLGVRRGDAYVQISGVAMPDNVDPWAVAADLVRETFANQH